MPSSFSNIKEKCPSRSRVKRFLSFLANVLLLAVFIFIVLSLLVFGAFTVKSSYFKTETRSRGQGAAVPTIHLKQVDPLKLCNHTTTTPMTIKQFQLNDSDTYYSNDVVDLVFYQHHITLIPCEHELKENLFERLRHMNSSLFKK